MHLRKILTLVALFLFFGGITKPAYAFSLGTDKLQQAGTGAGITPGSVFADLPVLIGTIISIILNLLGVIFLVLFIYAGILWMTSQGDPKQVTKAKDIMRAAVIGLILTLSAYGISQIVIVWLTGDLGTGGV